MAVEDGVAVEKGETMKIWMVLAANALALAMLAWPHAVGGLVATVVMMSAIGLGGGWLANRLHERRTRRSSFALTR